MNSEPPPFPSERFPDPPAEHPLPENPDLRDLFEALLRRPQELGYRLTTSSQGGASRFSLMAGISFLLFGLVLGCFAKDTQLWAAPLKTVAGIVIASVICFPSLYIFSTLAGGKCTVSQLCTSFAAAMALAGLLLMGFAPAVWIFAESTDSYGFVGALGVGAWMIALVFGLRFLKDTVRSAGGHARSPMAIWGILFALVTLQMTTSLRPILGRSPDFLTGEKKFFLQHWGDWMGQALKTPPQPSR